MKTRRIRTPDSPDEAHEEVFYSSIAAAIRWLNDQAKDELVDDDSVGWWLLLEFGMYPSGNMLKEMSQKLDSLIEGKPLTNGNLYTFTAIARTLFRAGYPLDDFPHLRKVWEETFDRKTRSRQLDIDYIWLLQMLVELWPEDSVKYAKYITPLLGSPDQKRLVPTLAALLLKKLGIDVASEARAAVCQRWWAAMESDEFEQSADWHISYGVLALLSFGEIEKAVVFGTRLCGNQQQGGWDESSVECIESTSLCGLAVLELVIAVSKTTNPSADRNKAMRSVSVLIDEYSWLLQAWETMKKMAKIQEKGWALEAFMKLWMSKDKYFENIQCNIRGGTDEVDIIADLKKDSPLSIHLEQSQFLFIECKNTSTPIGAPKIRIFRDQLRSRRAGNVKLGAYVSTSGFSGDAVKLANEDLGGDRIILLFDGRSIESGLRKRLAFSTIMIERLKQDVVRRP